MNLLKSVDFKRILLKVTFRVTFCRHKILCAKVNTAVIPCTEQLLKSSTRDLIRAVLGAGWNRSLPGLRTIPTLEEQRLQSLTKCFSQLIIVKTRVSVARKSVEILLLVSSLKPNLFVLKV